MAKKSQKMEIDLVRFGRGNTALDISLNEDLVLISVDGTVVGHIQVLTEHFIPVPNGDGYPVFYPLEDKKQYFLGTALVGIARLLAAINKHLDYKSDSKTWNKRMPSFFADLYTKRTRKGAK